MQSRCQIDTTVFHNVVQVPPLSNDGNPIQYSDIPRVDGLDGNYVHLGSSMSGSDAPPAPRAYGNLTDVPQLAVSQYSELAASHYSALVMK